MSVIAANFGLIASPVSAVVTGTIAVLAGLHVSALDILLVTVPGTFLGCVVGCLFVFKEVMSLKMIRNSNAGLLKVSLVMLPTY